MSRINSDTVWMRCPSSLYKNLQGDEVYIRTLKLALLKAEEEGKAFGFLCLSRMEAAAFKREAKRSLPFLFSGKTDVRFEVYDKTEIEEYFFSFFSYNRDKPQQGIFDPYLGTIASIAAGILLYENQPTAAGGVLAALFIYNEYVVPRLALIRAYRNSSVGRGEKRTILGIVHENIKHLLKETLHFSPGQAAGK